MQRNKSSRGYSDRVYIKVKVNVEVKLSLCFNWAPLHEGVLGSGGVAALILDRPARSLALYRLSYHGPW
jgi:hypothetical protein